MIAMQCSPLFACTHLHMNVATVHHEHMHSSQVRASPLAPLVPLAVVLALALVMFGVMVISVVIVSVIKFKFTCKLTQPDQGILLYVHHIYMYIEGKMVPYMLHAVARRDIFS